MCILRGIIIFHNQDANASLPTKKGLKWGQPSILHEAKGGNNGHQLSLWQHFRKRRLPSAVILLH